MSILTLNEQYNLKQNEVQVTIRVSISSERRQEKKKTLPQEDIFSSSRLSFADCLSKERKIEEEKKKNWRETA